MGQVSLFPLDDYQHGTPLQRMVATYAAERGGVTVHTLWVEGMTRQNRQPEPARMVWSSLTDDDRNLDGFIARAIVNAYEEQRERDGLAPATPAVCDGQLRLFPIDQYRALPIGAPKRAEAEAFCDRFGDKAAYDAWVDGMVQQGRCIKGDYASYTSLPHRDRQLFYHLCLGTLLDYLRWHAERGA